MTNDDEVLEVAIRHLLRDTPASTKDGICLRVRKTDNDLGDASDPLLAALRATWPTAVKDSACEGGGPQGPVRVKAGGAEALRVDVGPVKWDGARAIIKGGVHAGGPSSHERELHIEKSGDGWKVAADKPGISI